MNLMSDDMLLWMAAIADDSVAEKKLDTFVKFIEKETQNHISLAFLRDILSRLNAIGKGDSVFFKVLQTVIDRREKGQITVTYTEHYPKEAAEQQDRLTQRWVSLADPYRE